MTDETKKLIAENKEDDLNILRFLKCTFGVNGPRLTPKYIHCITINDVVIEDLEYEDIDYSEVIIRFDKDLPAKASDNSIILCEWKPLDKSLTFKFKKTKLFEAHSETYKVIDESLTPVAESLEAEPKLALDSFMNQVSAWYCE